MKEIKLLDSIKFSKLIAVIKHDKLIQYLIDDEFKIEIAEHQLGTDIGKYNVYDLSKYNININDKKVSKYYKIFVSDDTEEMLCCHCIRYIDSTYYFVNNYATSGWSNARTYYKIE